MIKERVLFAASEIYPFAKSGGLADVAYSLPRALSSQYDLCVVMPLYQLVDRERFTIGSLNESFEITMGEVNYSVELYGCEYEGIRYYFIYSPLLSERKYLYGSPEHGYEDNAIRFGIFNYAIVEMLKRENYAIAHLNDWQCALVPLLLQTQDALSTKTVFTIHNLAYQGVFEKKTLEQLGIDENFYTLEGIEFYDQVNFMKAGIAYADSVSTVSPNYAKEIVTTEFGYGLEGFLKHHQSKLIGILNGIDTLQFSPSSDKTLLKLYSGLTGKAINRRAYLKSVGLKGIKKPLFIFIGRFTWQKGMDLLIETLPSLATFECNIAILGEGEAVYHTALESIAKSHRNIYLEFGFDESLSHRLYAAGDFLLMPSLFEPCGLNQMIAMRYGSVPVVHKIGGLADSVISEKEFNTESTDGYGITFDRANQGDFIAAIEQAIELYENKRRYNRICRHNMQCDFSWQESAKEYEALYNNQIDS